MKWGLLEVNFLSTDAFIMLLLVSNLILWIEFRAMKISTHRVQYIDPFQDLMEEQRKVTQDAPFEKLTTKTKEKLTKDNFDNIQ